MLPLLHNTFGYLSLAVLRSCYISTLKDPSGHLPGRRVPCVISNAEGVFLGQLSRSIFDGCCDHMLADFELQCTMAKHPSWKIMAALISRYLNGFFKLHGNGLCWRAINTSGNICCSIRALRYCSVFWSHDRCIISTSRWSCGASTRSRYILHMDGYFVAIVWMQGSLNVTYASYLTHGHLLDDLRDECSVCQKHYADNEAPALSGNVSIRCSTASHFDVWE
jgi:hypothetical protein